MKSWASELHLDEEPEDVQRVVDGDLSATEFFMNNSDGKLTDEDFNEQGNKFAKEYYGDDGLYLEDYGNNFGELMYVAPEKDHDFDRFTSILDSRLKSGILTKQQAGNGKPWWKFW